MDGNREVVTVHHTLSTTFSEIDTHLSLHFLDVCMHILS